MINRIEQTLAGNRSGSAGASPEAQNAGFVPQSTCYASTEQRTGNAAAPRSRTLSTRPTNIFSRFGGNRSFQEKRKKVELVDGVAYQSPNPDTFGTTGAFGGAQPVSQHWPGCRDSAGLSPSAPRSISRSTRALRSMIG